MRAKGEVTVGSGCVYIMWLGFMWLDNGALVMT